MLLQRFVILCRTCALYKTYWEPVVTLSSASSCDCTQFSLNRCPHFLPAQWLCQVTGYCPEQFSYDQEYCAVNACGVNAQDEATWRQCN